MKLISIIVLAVLLAGCEYHEYDNYKIVIKANQLGDTAYYVAKDRGDIIVHDYGYYSDWHKDFVYLVPATEYKSLHEADSVLSELVKRAKIEEFERKQSEMEIIEVIE
jgi:hypothetical protein